MANHPVRNGVARTAEGRERGQIAEQERRLAFRTMLVASAEAEELTNEVSVPARTSDVSVHGCYLDTINPFPSGTRIRVHLTKGNETFHSLAVVICAHDGMGMGVAYTEISPEAREIIQRWVAEMEGGKALPAASDSMQNPVPGISNDGRTTLRVERLVQILGKKGLLTQEEARRILS